VKQAPAGSGPSGAQLVTLTAATAWVALHVARALVFHEENREPLLLGVCLAVVVAAHGVALAPLVQRRDPRLSAPVAWALAAVAVLVSAVVQSSLTPAGLAGYANWPLGGLSPLLAALILRHRVGAATAAAVGMGLVNALNVRSAMATAELDLAHGVAVTVPLFVWCLGAYLVRRALDRAASMTDEYRRRTAEAEASEQVARAVRRADGERRADLRAYVAPLLQEIGRGHGAVPERDRLQSMLLASSLRDDLAARSLLTVALHVEISSARARGGSVTLSCDLPDGTTAASGADGLVPLTQRVLHHLLGELGPGRALTCRVTGEPPATVVVVRGLQPGEGPRLAEALRRAVAPTAAFELTVDEADGELLATLAPVDG
jgi:hypothetical protein